MHKSNPRRDRCGSRTRDLQIFQSVRCRVGGVHVCIRWGSNPRLRRDWGLNPTPFWFIVDERPTRPRIPNGRRAIGEQLRRDSNPQPPDSKSDTLSIAPRSLRKEGRGRGTLLARAEAAEVLGRLGHDVRAERHLDAPRRLAADGHVEEDLRAFWRSRRGGFCMFGCGARGGGGRWPLLTARSMQRWARAAPPPSARPAGQYFADFQAAEAALAKITRSAACRCWTLHLTIGLAMISCVFLGGAQTVWGCGTRHGQGSGSARSDQRSN